MNKVLCCHYCNLSNNRLLLELVTLKKIDLSGVIQSGIFNFFWQLQFGLFTLGRFSVVCSKQRTAKEECYYETLLYFFSEFFYSAFTFLCSAVSLRQENGV